MKWKLLFLAFALFMGTSLMWAKPDPQGYSHARIVRLSFVDGTVLVTRPGVKGPAKASVNTPIEQGFSVSTGNNSFAEVEFENGSTARLGQLSKVDFTTLALNPKGDKISDLTFVQGYATFHLMPQHHDLYTVRAADSTITPRGKTEFRTDLAADRLRVQVFSGSVEVKDPKQSVKLTKNKTLETDPQTLSAFNITHGIEKDSWDHWVEKRDAQVAMAFNDSPVSTNSMIYGWSDLDAYGEWGFFPGYGYGWAPFVPAGWSPFSMGQWSWYPGWGYTWISSEPWGWLPFHYGYWNYSRGFGYFWTPGNLMMWNPAPVAWFEGPGYVGWSAIGPNGVPVCTTSGCVTTARPGTVQNGRPIDTNTRIHVGQESLTPVQQPQIRPTELGRLPGAPIASQMNVRTTGAPGRSFQASPAPNVLLMGQRQTVAPREGREAGPLQARLGNTLGGQYRTFTRAGASSSEAGRVPGQVARESSMNIRSTHPVFLEHRSSGFSLPAARYERGEIRPVYRGATQPGFSAPIEPGPAPAAGAPQPAYQGGGMGRGANRATPSSGRR